MNKILRLILIPVTLILPIASEAAAVTWNLSGTVQYIRGGKIAVQQELDALGVNAGADWNMSVTMNSDTEDLDTDDPMLGTYSGAIDSMSISIGSWIINNSWERQLSDEDIEIQSQTNYVINRVPYYDYENEEFFEGVTSLSYNLFEDGTSIIDEPFLGRHPAGIGFYMDFRYDDPMYADDSFPMTPPDVASHRVTDLSISCTGSYRGSCGDDGSGLQNMWIRLSLDSAEVAVSAVPLPAAAPLYGLSIFLLAMARRRSSF